jgi:hypothetical protein
MRNVCVVPLCVRVLGVHARWCRRQTRAHPLRCCWCPDTRYRPHRLSGITDGNSCQGASSLSAAIAAAVASDTAPEHRRRVAGVVHTHVLARDMEPSSFGHARPSVRPSPYATPLLLPGNTRAGGGGGCSVVRPSSVSCLGRTGGVAATRAPAASPAGARVPKATRVGDASRTPFAGHMTLPDQENEGVEVRSGARAGPFALVDAIPAGSGAGAAMRDSTSGRGAAPGAVARVFASSERPKTAAPAGSAAARREGTLPRSSNAGPAAAASRSHTSVAPACRGGEPTHVAVGAGASTHRGTSVHRTPASTPTVHPVSAGRSSRRGVGKVEQPGWGLGGSAQAAPHGPGRAPQDDAVVPVVGVVVGVDPVADAVVVRTSMESLPLHAAGRRQRMTWWVRE